MKKKIKKWYIVVLVILGIGGYWMSQNMWVFEKQIAVEDYESFLANTMWEDNTNKTIWQFNNDFTYSQREINNLENQITETWSITDTWSIENNKLIFRDSILPVEYEIFTLTKTTLGIVYRKPSINIKSPVLKLKKL